MKEAIGNSFLVSLSIVFLFLIMLMLVSALSYSKAYKAKNKIVSIIEKYDGFTEEAETEINTDLFKMGYRTSLRNRSCGEKENMALLHDTDNGTYNYCVYEVSSSRGKYYHVITYMHFDLPVLEEYLTIEVNGDSRTVVDGENLEG